MARLDRAERKLKRLRSIEAGYRREMKAAEKLFEEGKLSREKFEKVRRRAGRRIERLAAHIRRLSQRTEKA